MRFLFTGWLAIATIAASHDTWLETSAALIRSGDFVTVDLKLGNHGNHHRDFKLASKIGLAGIKLEAIGPGGARIDLAGQLRDTGLTEKEGYWSAAFVPETAGTWCLVQTSDRVLNHGKPVRTVRSAKAFVNASDSLDSPKCGGRFGAPLGLPIEICPEFCPVMGARAGRSMSVRLFRDGKPVVDEVVSFIPRGVELQGDFDPTYEARTDAEGRAKFTPPQANVYLVVAHHDVDEKGDGYESTRYSATLTLRVPPAQTTTK